MSFVVQLYRSIIDAVKERTDNLPNAPANQATAGSFINGLAVTNVIFVCASGDNSDGTTPSKAYTTIQEALENASIDPNDLTLIMISPHETQYDINTAGDPTFSGNYILQGSGRTFAKIVNNHAAATSILKLTGKVIIKDLNFNLGTGTNGLIITHGGSIIDNCIFVGSLLTKEAVALHIADGTLKHGDIRNGCHFDGHVSYMTGIKMINCSHWHFEHLHIHDCLHGILIDEDGGDSDNNVFERVDFDRCAIGFNIDAGSAQNIKDCVFDNCNENIDDEVGDHIYESITGHFSMDTLPDDLTGTTITASADANVWGASAEILSAASRLKPFKIIDYFVIPDASELRKIRFSANGGLTWFDEIIINADKQAGESPPAGTERIFNAGAQIIAQMKSESAGSDTAKTWIKIQEI